jgi:hypothetical protein
MLPALHGGDLRLDPIRLLNAPRIQDILQNNRCCHFIDFGFALIRP